MGYPILFVTFCIGLAIGSFFNVVLARLDRKGGILAGRSECPHCHHLLQWFDLIPLFSFLLLKGRCRYCHKPISVAYPLVEAGTALVVVLFVVFRGLPSDAMIAVQMAAVLALFLLAIFDLRFLWLPDKITLPLAVFSLAYAALFHGSAFLGHLFSGFFIALFFAILYAASRGRWMGLGDAKLALCTGFLLGYPNAVFATFYAVWVATAVGLVMMAFDRANMKTKLPFGLFLALMTAAFIIFPEQLPVWRIILP